MTSEERAERKAKLAAKYFRNGPDLFHSAGVTLSHDQLVAYSEQRAELTLLQEEMVNESLIALLSQMMARRLDI